ncbi:MAG: hypothetical protein EWM45_16195 [Rhodopseudomonas palustris]|uniref:hypothetical protein n=1 Tax=Rhodopseudomonas faecalis TaxID=99655 RepID=UPI0011B7AC2A|nr:hypothetical protein [Rhodopseudomonas faecalis]TAH65150.1 MAG: hypothetical protein EWM45_16195 [Rhodopseudomonas palustris]
MSATNALLCRGSALMRRTAAREVQQGVALQCCGAWFSLPRLQRHVVSARPAKFRTAVLITSDGAQRIARYPAGR